MARRRSAAGCGDRAHDPRDPAHQTRAAIANSIQLVRDGSLGWFLDNVPPRLMERAAAFVARHPEVAPGRGAWMAAAAREARMRADLVPHPGSRVTGR
jgi:hypothetical protein